MSLRPTRPAVLDRGSASVGYQDAAVVAVEAIEAPEVVTSAWFDEQLSEVYARTGLRAGVLFHLAGIRSRRWWPSEFTFHDAAAAAGTKALDAAGLSADDVDLLISSSVSRHHLEPSVAASVHSRLGLAPGCINFDVSSACVGLLNAMQIAATAIDTGTIETALIVNAEGSRQLQLATLERLRRDATTADDVFAEFASLTLGSGAAAVVMGRHSDHEGSHRLIRSVTRAGTEHHQLCIGDLDRMDTDSGALLAAGIELVLDAWADADSSYGWADADHFIIHQVSKVHTRLVIERLGLDPARVPTTFTDYGNIGPASVAITLAGHAEQIRSGEKVLCLGVGSGLNTSYLELLW